jgi:F-box/leucine-rich repeat protein 10/11
VWTCSCEICNIIYDIYVKGVEEASEMSQNASAAKRHSSRQLRERKQKKLYSEDWALGDDEIEGRRSFNLQEKLENPLFATHNIVREMHGNELNVAYFQKHGFNTPLLFKEKTGLGECGGC